MYIHRAIDTRLIDFRFKMLSCYKDTWSTKGEKGRQICILNKT